MAEHFSRMTSRQLSVSVSVPATSANLGPGFDALGLALDITNRLTLRASEEDELEVLGEGRAQLLGQASTIAHDSARRVLRELKLEIPGFHLAMENAIPLARGLGSSSAAIVAGLVAGNAWARAARGRGLENRDLLRLANEIEGHPDNVAPALLGGLVVSAVSSSGEVRAVQLPVREFPGFAVFIPTMELTTHHARAVLPSNLSLGDAVFNLSRSSLLVAALASGELDVLPEALLDRLHQNQRAALIPGFAELIAWAPGAGAYGATLSGAGPTILYWLPPELDVLTFCESLHKEVEILGLAGQVRAVRAVETGAQID